MSSNANRQGWWMRFEPRQELTIAPFNFASISGIANLQAGSPLAGEIGLSSLLAKVTFSSSHAYTLAMIIGSLACVGRSTHPYRETTLKHPVYKTNLYSTWRQLWPH